MNIAVFADVHGRALLAFQLCARWEQEAGETLDLILQAGDLGAFPTEESYDRATRDHAKVDLTEMGFMRDFATYNDEAAAILAKTACPMICVRGNHEAQVWLDGLEAKASLPIYTIDAYQRIWMLKTGVPYTFDVKEWARGLILPTTPDDAHATGAKPTEADQSLAGDRLSIIGVGRIAAPPGAFSNAPDTRGRANRYISPEESLRIHALRVRSCDVLLSHDSAPDMIKPGSGSADIGWLLSKTDPIYHFWGHYGGPAETMIDANHQTIGWKLADLHWGKGASNSMLDEGSMGILRWNERDEHSFALVEDSWLREYTPHSWRYL